MASKTTTTTTRTRQRATLAEIGRLSKVSPTVVSQVLSGRKGTSRYSDETAKRVKQIAKRLHYRPGLASKFVRQGRTQILGIAIPSIIEAYVARLLPACIEAASDLGFQLLVNQAVLTSDDYDERISKLLDANVDGLIFFGKPSFFESELHKELIATRQPVVCVEHDVVGSEIDFIGIDETNCSRLAVEHLKKLGHQRIGFLYEQESQIPAAHDRRVAFENAIEQAKLPVLSDAYIQTSHNLLPNVDAVISKLTDPDEAITAVVVRGHKRARWLYDHLVKSNFRIPKNLSIIDMTAHDYAAEAFKFNSVRTPLEAMGKQAVELLVARINNPERPAQRVLCAGELKPGHTVHQIHHVGDVGMA